jgi:hypothetical protein
MQLAFVTGAVAASFAGAGLVTLVIWVLTVLTGSGEAWGPAPWVVAAVAVAFGALTYAAEQVAQARTEQLQRESGEPWAYRR